MLKLYKAVCDTDPGLIYAYFDDEQDATMFVDQKNKVRGFKFLVVQPFDAPPNLESVLLDLFYPVR